MPGPQGPQERLVTGQRVLIREGACSIGGDSGVDVRLSALVLPGPAGFRVGNETRQWRMGEAWVFDDTIEHAAWNDADETRVILIFDVWNPLLCAAERELISAMLREHRQWLAQPATA